MQVLLVNTQRLRMLFAVNAKNLKYVIVFGSRVAGAMRITTTSALPVGIHGGLMGLIHNMWDLAKQYNLYPLHPALAEILRLTNLVAELEKELGRPFVMEAGPWEADPNGRYIQSDSFNHDVMLRVDGDFEGDEQRIAYANEMARRLNAYHDK